MENEETYFHFSMKYSYLKTKGIKFQIKINLQTDLNSTPALNLPALPISHVLNGVSLGTRTMHQ